jgi:hypothetical protein
VYLIWYPLFCVFRVTFAPFAAGSFAPEFGNQLASI